MTIGELIGETAWSALARQISVRADFYRGAAVATAGGLMSEWKTVTGGPCPQCPRLNCVGCAAQPDAEPDDDRDYQDHGHQEEVLAEEDRTDEVREMYAEDNPGAMLLDDLVTWWVRFIPVTDPDDLYLLALWTVHTHLVVELYTTPRLLIDSVMEGSGKSTVMDHLNRLCVSVFRPPPFHLRR